MMTQASGHANEQHQLAPSSGSSSTWIVQRPTNSHSPALIGIGVLACASMDEVGEGDKVRVRAWQPQCSPSVCGG